MEETLTGRGRIHKSIHCFPIRTSISRQAFLRVGEDVLIASGALVGPPAVLLSMIACLILLALRVWVGVVGLTLARRVTLYVDGAIAVIFVLFVLFVIIRFKSLA